MIDKSVIDAIRAMTHENWHIHSLHSKCAMSEMTLSSIAIIAEEVGLKKIAIVDHHHRDEDKLLKILEALRSDLAKINTPVEILIGAELSAYDPGDYAHGNEAHDYLDFRLYACNHYHHPAWKHPEKTTPRSYAEHSIAILKDLIPTGRAQCIAHPFLGCYLTQRLKDITLMTAAYTDDELIELFELSNKHGVAWEISLRHLVGDPVFARRYLTLGFKSGVDFRLGTDAHRLFAIDTKPQIDHLVQVLSQE